MELFNVLHVNGFKCIDVDNGTLQWTLYIAMDWSNNGAMVELYRYKGEDGTSETSGLWTHAEWDRLDRRLQNEKRQKEENRLVRKLNKLIAARDKLLAKNKRMVEKPFIVNSNLDVSVNILEVTKGLTI